MPMAASYQGCRSEKRQNTFRLAASSPLNRPKQLSPVPVPMVTVVAVVFRFRDKYGDREASSKTGKNHGNGEAGK